MPNFLFGPSGGGSSSLTVGTTVIASGADKQVLFDDAGKVGEDAALLYDKTAKALSVGTAPVAASGLIRLPNNTTAIAIRNAANSADLTLTLNGSNQWIWAGSGTQDFGAADIFMHGDGNLFRMGTVADTLFGKNISPGSFRFVNSGTGGSTSSYTTGLKTLPNNTATIFVKHSMTSGSQCGGVVHYSIENITTRGCIAGKIPFAAQDTAGAITASIKNADTDQQLIGGGAGFANNGFTVTDAGSNVLNILANAQTTGGTDTLQIRYTIIVNDVNAVTPQ